MQGKKTQFEKTNSELFIIKPKRRTRTKVDALVGDTGGDVIKLLLTAKVA
jgi:hypothetical protein